MRRLALLMTASIAVIGGFGCSKPTEGDCRKAITNMQRLMGTENLKDADGIESEVRRCKGGSTKKAVSCAIAAQTLDDLRKCEFFKVPEGAKGIGTKDEGSAGSAAGSGSAMGSGSADVGSAAGSGSADIGSASGGSAAGTGSAGSTPVGSAGSAALGSAVGSAK